MAISAAIDSSVTYATLNPAQVHYGGTLSNGNLTGSFGDSNGGISSTAAFVPNASLHHYYEATINTLATGSSIDSIEIGINLPAYIGGAPPGITYVDPINSVALVSDGTMQAGQSVVATTGVTFVAGDTVKIYMAPGGGMYVGKVGAGWPAGHDPTVSGDTPYYTVPSGSWRPAIGGYAIGNPAGDVITVNFGATAWMDTPPTGAVGWTV
jgi:hypothetical protein